jgi:hypothetical protein
MAEQDDTSKPTRRRRNKPAPGSTPAALATPDSDLLPGAEPPPPPTTLEEAIERVRTHLMEGRAMLHCLSEVLLYADDPDSVTHAEVAQAVSHWINYSAEQLDLVKLRPLIDAIKQRKDEPQGDSGNYPPYQVREPTAIYHA